MNTEVSPLASIQKMLSASAHIDLLSDINITNTYPQELENRSTKINILHQILKDIETYNEKAIIFTRSIKMQQILYKCIDYWFKLKVNIINGKVKSLDQRTRLINEFRNKKGFNVIILSPDVAGFGITLTEANHVIHYMRLWNPAKEEQATDRAYRIGQDRDVTVYYPILSFSEEGIYKYNNVKDYIDNNKEVNKENLSPEEKLNILMARKRNMLLKFFLAAGNGDIEQNEFMKFDNTDKKKDIIKFEDIENNIIDEFEFEALTAMLYENMGYRSYVTTRSNDNGVDVVCIKDETRILIQCKKVKKLDSISTIKDLLYAKDVYHLNTGLSYKLVVVTNTNIIPEKIKQHEYIKIIDGKNLEELLNKYNIYKNEIDIKNLERNSLEKLKFILKSQL